MPTRPLALGRARPVVSAESAPAPLDLPAHHLVTHGVVLGMTGSGKTGLALVLVEEALRSGIPVLMIDVKGDLGNLLFTFPELAAADFEPWIDAAMAAREGRTAQREAELVAARWREGLSSWGLGPADLHAFKARFTPRLITPGSTAAEPLHVLSALETPSPLWEEDEELARESLSAAISLLLRLLDRDADPARSREHVMLSHLAEMRLRKGSPAGLAELLAGLESPPMAKLGALTVDEFLPPKDRLALAQQINTLLASPTFATWRKGASLDIEAWMKPGPEGRVPAVIVSVAHLDDAERQLVLGLLLEQVLSWVRGLPGTSDLRALLLFDEVYGFLPPHPANPPTKRPLLSLLKQARAFGVGVVVATQNPMDLDYKALSNAGAWFVGRLQTDADRERVVEGLADAAAGSDLDRASLAQTLKALPPRTFLLRDVHHKPSSLLLETRFCLSWLRGPLTRREIGRLHKSLGGSAPPQAIAAPPVNQSAPINQSAPASQSAPAGPPGWKVVYAHAPAGAPSNSQLRYVPWVAATVIAHARDTKLGVARNRARTVAAPLGEGARLDLARAADLDPARLRLTPAPGVAFAPLPEGLFRKNAAQAVERSLREHVYRSVDVEIDVHADLGLVREDGEPADAFAARCRGAAARRLAAVQQEIVGKYAPKIAKLADRRASAEARLNGAAQEANALPGALGTALIGLVAGRGTARKAESQRGRAEVRLEKARADLAESDAALREAVAARDAEIAAAARAAEGAATGIERRKLAVKKGDVEVTEIALAWGVEG